MVMPFRAPRLSRPHALLLTPIAGESAPALIACLANPWWNNQRSSDDNLDVYRQSNLLQFMSRAGYSRRTVSFSTHLFTPQEKISPCLYPSSTR